MNLESQVNNFNNYYVYSNLIRNGSIVIKTDTITLDNWSNHYCNCHSKYYRLNTPHYYMCKLNF